MTDPIALRDLAAEVAADSAQFVRSQVGTRYPADTKSSPTDMVTEIDRAAEARIVAAILDARPRDAIMGEEGTDRPGTSGVRWVVDPIDGTTNFVFGHPGYSVSIAAEVDGTVVAGAVADPEHGQLFDAAIGSGARCNGDAIAVRPTTDLGRALLATGFSFRPERRLRQAHALSVILPEVGDIRRMGSAAIDLCSVAIGRVDAYYEIGLNPWDVAAGALIAAEAGAVVRQSASPDGEGGLMIVAATPGISEALSGLLARSNSA